MNTVPAVDEVGNSGRPSARLQWGVRIPLPDGLTLHALLYLPNAGPARCPVIVTLTPYTGQRYHDEAVYFAAHGYGFAAVDVRGRGMSDGVFEPMINDGQDGHDIIEWIAQQPFCNGQVVMWGASYMGYTQWVTAAQGPPHLSAIAPVAAPYMGVDFPLRNNLWSTYLVQWLMLVAGRTSQINVQSDQSFWAALYRRWGEEGTAFRQLDTFVGHPSRIFQEWVGHPTRGAYWDRYNPTTQQYSDVSIPILTITGIYDGDQPGALAHYRKHLAACAPGRARHFLVIGPWSHDGLRLPTVVCAGLRTGPASLLDYRQLHVQWYDWILRAGRRPGFLKANVAYYMTGAEEWRWADSLAAVTIDSRPLYLQAAHNPLDVFHSGTLAQAPLGECEPAWYHFDPRDRTLAELEMSVDPESAVDQRLVLAGTGRQLIYHSAAFNEVVEIAGFFNLVAWIAIDQPDTDIRVGVYDIALDGSSVLLSTAALRARYRKSRRAERLIETIEPLRYDFDDFAFSARRIERGHRLRLVIGPVNSIYQQLNHNSGGTVADETVKDRRSVIVRLFHDQRYPSALTVPIGRSTHEDAYEGVSG